MVGLKLHDVNSPASGAMRSVYKEMLSRPAILVAIVMVAVAVAACAVLGPMGTYDALTAWQRLAFGALYAVLGWPLGYAAIVVAAYFLRRQSALTMALTLTAVALFVSLPCTAVVHTVETLAHPHYSASAGLMRLYIQVATVAVVYDLLFLYLVYVRSKHRHALAAARTSNTNSAVAAAPPADELVDQDPVDQDPGRRDIPGVRLHHDWRRERDIGRRWRGDRYAPRTGRGTRSRVP